MDRDIELAISRDDTLLKHHTDSWTSSQIDRHALRLALEAAWAEIDELKKRNEVLATELGKCLGRLELVGGPKHVLDIMPTDYPKEGTEDGD